MRVTDDPATNATRSAARWQHVCDRAVEQAIGRYQGRQDALIEVLHHAQASCGYLDREILARIARRMKLPLSRVYGVATFYHLFHLKPQAAHSCILCDGTACYIHGGRDAIAAVEREFHLKPGQTTPDGRVQLSVQRCIGNCGIAPAAIYDGVVAKQQRAADVVATIRRWLNEPEFSDPGHSQ